MQCNAVYFFPISPFRKVTRRRRSMQKDIKGGCLESITQPHALDQIFSSTHEENFDLENTILGVLMAIHRDSKNTTCHQ